MTKKEPEKPITKTDFLRKTLTRAPSHKLAAINRLWARAGHPGEISSGLYYKVRHDLGIKTVWVREPVAEPSRSSSAEAPRSRGRVYQLKVTLRGVRPPIWRRIQVPDCSLERLHEIIQVAMGWGSCHLYGFDVGPEGYTDPGSALELDMERADRVRLGDVVLGEKAKLRYTYDFGDDWDHEILVEKILPAGEGAACPQCLTGKRACPPDDVGGVWGYLDFVTVMQGPKTKRRRELLEWAGGEYDPEEFDLEAVNKVLRRM